MNPSVIVCDEPTSALDVTTQARVLALLSDLQKDTGVAYLFISHDLGVVHGISDRIAVLQGGRIVELGDAQQVATNPQHPYTHRLQMSAPVADPPRQRARRAERLRAARRRHAARCCRRPSPPSPDAAAPPLLTSTSGHQ